MVSSRQQAHLALTLDFGETLLAGRMVHAAVQDVRPFEGQGRVHLLALQMLPLSICRLIAAEWQPPAAGVMIPTKPSPRLEAPKTGECFRLGIARHSPEGVQ